MLLQYELAGLLCLLTPLVFLGAFALLDWLLPRPKRKRDIPYQPHR